MNTFLKVVFGSFFGIILALLFVVLLLFKSCSMAFGAELSPNQLPSQNKVGERLKMEGKRVVTVDEFGETRHNKPKYIVEDNCLVPTDSFGIPRRNEGKVCFQKK